MIRVLPSFADLMLLPPAIVPGAEVFMKYDRIAVRVADREQRHFVATQIDDYPHVEVRTDDEGDLIFDPIAANYRRLLLVWPDGRSEGVLLWDGGYYSPCGASAMEALLSSGLYVQTVFCRPEDTLPTVLLKLTGRMA